MLDFLDFRVLDVIDIFVVALLLWQIYKAIRGTAAMSIFAGIFILYLVWIVVRVLGMELLSTLLGQVIGVGALALLIVFQQEVRRYLLMLGNKWASQRGSIFSRVFMPKGKAMESQQIQEVAAACQSMASSFTGALVVFSRLTDIGVYSATGDRIDAMVSKRLIENIFFKNAPLHDGAMIISEGRIEAARCVLPTSDNPNIPAHLGMRHRAAVGLSEQSDAVVIVVSEERGMVSIVSGGNIRPVGSAENLGEIIAAVLAKN
ncbi:MAG: diadenylate cyclase CdaA [Mucinivorans sp.]